MDIIEKAKELGELIADSNEIKKMRNAEIAVEKDETASQLMNSYTNKRMEIRKLQTSGKPNKEQVVSLTKEMVVIEDKMKRNKVIKEYMDAAKKFNNMIQQVNGVLKHYITGSRSDCNNSDCGGCSSGCK